LDFLTLELEEEGSKCVHDRLENCRIKSYGRKGLQKGWKRNGGGWGEGGGGLQCACSVEIYSKNEEAKKAHEKGKGKK
jgi:hypothetical protein